MTVLHALAALLLLPSPVASASPPASSPFAAPPAAASSAAASAGAASSAAAFSGAVAGSVQPLIYEVNLSSDATGARWDGRERIVLRNPGPATMDHLWLRLWGNGVDGCAATPDVTVTSFQGGTPGELEVGCTAVRVRLDRPLLPHRTAALSFALTIRVPERPTGSAGSATTRSSATPCRSPPSATTSRPTSAAAKVSSR